MGMASTLTRMWLTRSLRPFVFKNEYDQQLNFTECRNLGLYVHIPFCTRICDFCPYCKEIYSLEKCNRYIDALIREIHLVGGQADGKKRVTTLYFGGGTPALAADRLPEIISALAEHFNIEEGIGVELHPDNVTLPVLRRLEDAGVDRISIGIQSFQEKYQKLLGRAPVDQAAMRRALSAARFATVSMDFIFALPGQSAADLRADVDAAFACGANHIAVYPFIDFACAAGTVQPLAKDEKRRLLDALTRHCLDRGCRRDSIWTFAAEAGAAYSSMTRDNFLGFGCSAATLLQDQFKINTFSVAAYRERLAADKLPTSLTLRFTRRRRMLYYLFWTAYTTRVRAGDFQEFFGTPLKKAFGFELALAKALGFAEERHGEYRMTDKGAFYYHHYENFHTLAYIDRMWGLMRREAFPTGMRL